MAGSTAKLIEAFAAPDGLQAAEPR